MFSKGSSVNAFIEAETRFVSLSIFDILTFNFCPIDTKSAGFFTLPWLRSDTWSKASIPLMSKNIPQSVVDLTIAFSTISPS